MLPLVILSFSSSYVELSEMAKLVRTSQLFIRQADSSVTNVISDFTSVRQSDINNLCSKWFRIEKTLKISWQKLPIVNFDVRVVHVPAITSSALDRNVQGINLRLHLPGSQTAKEVNKFI